MRTTHRRRRNVAILRDFIYRPTAAAGSLIIGAQEPGRPVWCADDLYAAFHLSGRRSTTPQRRQGWRRCIGYCSVLLVSRRDVLNDDGQLTKH